MTQNIEIQKTNQKKPAAYELVFKKDLFPLEAIRSACFDFLDRAFALFEEKEDHIKIILRPSDTDNADTLLKEFQNHLIQVTSAHLHKQRNEELRELVRMHAQKNKVQIKETGFDDPAFADLEKSLADLQSESLDDPLGISDPWIPGKSK